jgi:glutamyl endopeptidase
MAIFSSGVELTSPSYRPLIALEHSFVSVCEPSPSEKIDIQGLEKSISDFDIYEHISNRGSQIMERAGSILDICGSDDRVAVADTKQYPFSAVCFLEITFFDGAGERRFIGTGFLYSATAVYTAAHCIHDHELGLARRIRVYPGRDGGNSPFGSLTSSTFYVPPEWVASHTPDFDYGAILLPQPGFTHTRFFGMEARPANYLTNETAKTAGYPGDKPYGTPWTVEGPIATVTNNRFYYLIDTMGGQSGSPVFTKNQYGFGNHYTLGIHCYGGCPNSSTRVIKQMIERLPTKA